MGTDVGELRGAAQERVRAATIAAAVVSVVGAAWLLPDLQGASSASTPTPSTSADTSSTTSQVQPGFDDQRFLGGGGGRQPMGGSGGS